MNTFSTPNGVSRLMTIGSIDLVQKENFALGKVERQIGFEDENDMAYLLRTEDIMSFMMNKYNLNTTTEYNIQTQYITKSESNSAAEEIEIDLMMDIPLNQEIRYTPSFLELAANFWVQYIALLIPSFYIIYQTILGNAFRVKILDSKVSSEI